ncbi:MAG: hypothetical protein V4714_15275 [Bacteroidota bacterium]
MKKIFWIVATICLISACTRHTTVVQNKTVVKKDNGKHKGWYKNPHNPHHPSNNTTTVVVVENDNGHGHGHGHGKSKGKGKGKGHK